MLGFSEGTPRLSCSRLMAETCWGQSMIIDTEFLLFSHGRYCRLRMLYRWSFHPGDDHDGSDVLDNNEVGAFGDCEDSLLDWT